MFLAEQIALITGGTLSGDGATRVSGPAVLDSRKVQEGSLFVALAGEHSDGHDFAATAIDNGAALVLGSREIAGLPMVVVPDVQLALGQIAKQHLINLRAAGDLKVIAITGSVGKTTTKDLIGQILSQHGATVVPAGSLNNELGLPLTVLTATAETRYLVVEMGASAPGDLTYLTSIAPPDVATVLIVGQAHLGGFGGIEDVARTKAELVGGLAPGGIAVLNADDLRVVAMKEQAPGEIITFGSVRDATFQAVNTTIRELGQVSFDVLTSDGSTEHVDLQLVGEHHLTNALAALASCAAVGIEISQGAQVLNTAQAISPHRMAVTERDGITFIDDSYNANPDSMRAALKALAVIAGRKRRTIAVLGEMLELGPDSRAHHDEIGRLVVRLNISLLVVVGQGASGFADGALQEGSWGDEVASVDTVEQAAALLEEELTAGDVVLLKSSNGSGLWRLADQLVGKAEQK
ncbi:UDP-N-acetylmuramoyl-tripeptide--D-alanyl-D-alanine ligase [Jonesiaceae bacterium BS-20]|uniref:UDP-N-acetylmuramoyl-tripeptide--D-alanyl-D-alanine ligase n=1 Tax=Jonesiaceae bacterium BS-20 TaxID=3120821 RepID=A0AAU7DXX9_9MICO